MEYLVAIEGLGMGKILMIIMAFGYFIYRIYSEFQKDKERQSERKAQAPSFSQNEERYTGHEQESPYFTYESLEFASKSIQEDSLNAFEKETKEENEFSNFYEEEEAEDFNLKEAIIHQIILEKKYV